MQTPQTVMGRRLAARALSALSERHPTAIIDQPQPPEAVCAAAKRALDQGLTHYTSGPGILPLRQAIARRSIDDGFPASPDAIIVTNGGAEALYIALQSALRKGDRLLIGGLVSPNVYDMLAFIDAEAIHLAGADAPRFMPQPAEIARADARTLLIASPSPVTGLSILDDILGQIIAAALEREMTVILDRSLAWCCREPEATQFSRADLGARILTTGSFSAAYAMSGWRVGYLSTPEPYLASMRELKQAMSICTSSISQHAALAALEESSDWLAGRHHEFAERYDTLVAALQGTDFAVVSPDAWPFVLIHAPDTIAAAAERLAGELRVRVEPATRHSDLLRGYLRADLRSGGLPGRREDR